MKILKYFLILMVIVSVSFGLLASFAPKKSEKYLKEIVVFVLNLKNVNEKDLKILNKYGIKLEFPKTKWIYDCYVGKSQIIVNLTKAYPYVENPKNQKCCLDALTIYVYENKTAYEKIKNYLKSISYKSKNITIVKKRFLAIYEKRKDGFWSAYFTSDDLNIIMSYLNNCEISEQRLKKALNYVKFE
jgi:hypothetical protein